MLELLDARDIDKLLPALRLAESEGNKLEVYLLGKEDRVWKFQKRVEKLRAVGIEWVHLELVSEPPRGEQYSRFQNLVNH